MLKSFSFEDIFHAQDTRWNYLISLIVIYQNQIDNDCKNAKWNQFDDSSILSLYSTGV